MNTVPQQTPDLCVAVVAVRSPREVAAEVAGRLGFLTGHDIARLFVHGCIDAPVGLFPR